MKAVLKTIMSITICMLLVGYMNVSALETEVHINSNGVELSDKEYDFVNEFYGTGFFDRMTQDDYEWLEDLDINNSNVRIKTIYSNDFIDSLVQPYGDFYETSNKRLSIAENCGSGICSVITNLTWLNSPIARSYDVIGARFVNTSLASDTITTKVTSSDGTVHSSNNKVYTDGFGSSVKLPDDAVNIIVQQKFFVYTGGTVYASYQHATSNVSLETSLSYIVDQSGYGNVFYFYGDAVGKYDRMSGVSIDL